MARAVLTLIVSCFACVLVAWGFFFWLPYVTRIGATYGSGWGLAAFGAATALCAALALGIWRLGDRLVRDPALGRGAPDSLYCQRCGRPARVDAPFCPACGSTSLALSRPDP